ncbi:hypothetical protein KY5_1000c [Streptomyces formicae]|uniref:Secreted protein n=2 Tax=Streptomyces formicae TaxID=1616117 RepID=A0A291Q3D1_9ACTN|nr:hypothetical protein KY5_1000c [Streptomyces formicae]
MGLNRRQLLRGSLAVGAAALPVGALAAPAYGVVHKPRAQARRAGFNLALLDVANGIITNHHTGDIHTNTKGEKEFGNPWATFRTGKDGAVGWDPLELKVRTLDNGKGEKAFLICGGDSTEGHVTIHRNSDGAPLGWVSGLTNFPHSLEYVPEHEVIIVVGPRGLGQYDPPPRGESEPGGCYEMYAAPTGGSVGPLKKIPIADKDRAFWKAHGVVWDRDKKLVWIYGGNKLRSYKVIGKGEGARLERANIEIVSDLFKNGHDLQPDPLEPEYLWATSSTEILQINKAGGYAFIQWSIPAKSVKSFARDRSGSAAWTADTLGNKYGDDKVRFMWYPDMTGPVTVPAVSGETTKPKVIYKARLLDI